MIAVIMAICIAAPGMLMAQFNLEELCLEMKGIITDDYDRLKGSTVNLYVNNDKVKTFTTSSTGKFQFLLNRDLQYTIEVLKEGYLPKKISINTTMPPLPESKVYVLNVFDFEVQMDEDLGNIFNEIKDFPIALISFDPKENAFDYSFKYTESIRFEINKLKTAYVSNLEL